MTLFKHLYQFQNGSQNGAQNFKFQINRNLQHNLESSKWATRQANRLKSIKKMKNYAKYQEISMASSEKDQIIHGGQWEINPKCAKTHKISQSGAYFGDL